MTQRPPTAFCAGITDTGFLEDGEKRTLHRHRQSSPDLPLGTEYTGPCKLALGQRPSSRIPWPSCPAPPVPSWKGWQGKEETELTSLKPQNVLNADKLQGISYCEHCCQSLLNSPARFPYDAELLRRLIPPVETHPCLLHLYLLKLWTLARASPYIYVKH